MSNTHIPKVLFVLLGLFGVAAIALFAYMGGRYSQSVVTNTNTNTPLPVEYINANEDAVEEDIEAINTNTDEVVVDTITTSTEVNWLAEPELLDNLHLLTNGLDEDKYYRVATIVGGGELIYVERVEMGVSVSRFWKDSKGQYYLLANHSDNYYSSNSAEALADDVAVNTDTTYPELDYPDTMTVNDLDLSIYTVGFQSYSLFVDITDDLTKFGSSEYGTVYSLVTPVTTTYDDGSIEGKKYILKLVDGSVVVYADRFDFLADDGSISGSWVKTYSDFRDRQYMSGIVVGGCGVQGGNQYPVDMTIESLETVGGVTANDGDTLYTILDAENPLLRNAYESYKVGRDYEGSTFDLLSYDEFVAETPVLLWQDAVGDYILFMDNDYAPAVECGKPVVYLYPTQTTDVTVQVGADVTKSEPTYQAGWSVSAQPNGQLTLADGNVYPNLFWEGKGFGEYPQITFGRVVPRVQVGLALRSDLIKQGLNAQEIKDFLDFWMPHMPNTPYVRLSWLSTQQLNQLAPLEIAPRPDTMIRTFLDFSGQTTANTTLAPQTLSAIPRNGFTVIEWGGLLLGQ